MNMRKRFSSGFTIVELLIVIVVIAILAAITIVSYNGIQQRTRTVAYVSAVDAIEKQLLMAVAEGKITRFGGVLAVGATTCLGRTADFPSEGVFEEGECMVYTVSGGEGRTGYAVDTATMPLLTQVSSVFSVGRLSNATVDLGTLVATGRGIAVGHTGSDLIIQWISPDRTTCGRAQGSMQEGYIKDAQKVVAGTLSLEEYNARYPSMTMTYEQIVSTAEIVGRSAGDLCMAAVRIP